MLSRIIASSPELSGNGYFFTAVAACKNKTILINENVHEPSTTILVLGMIIYSLTKYTRRKVEKKLKNSCKHHGATTVTKVTQTKLTNHKAEWKQ